MKTQKGFSVIELIIVIVVIAIIAAIAFPNLLAARRVSNESSAVSSLRTYFGAQKTYQSTVGAGNFAGSSQVLTTQAFSELHAQNLLDESLGSGVKNGYIFIGAQIPASAGRSAQFTGYAYPSVLEGVDKTGTRVFSISNNGVIITGSYGQIVTSTNGGTFINSTGGSPLNE